MALFESEGICEKEIQMHHVKHIRKSNELSTGFTKIMSELNTNR